MEEYSVIGKGLPMPEGPAKATGSAIFTTDMACISNMPLSMVRVIRPHVGGGFGGKVEMRPSHFCSALLASKTGRPVKITDTREEVFTSALRRHSVE